MTKVTLLQKCSVFSYVWINNLAIRLSVFHWLAHRGHVIILMYHCR